MAQAFTEDAAELINRMCTAGWSVTYHRTDGAILPRDRWEFTKLCDGKPGCGKFWRIGTHSDIFTAAEAALKAEANKD